MPTLSIQHAAPVRLLLPSGEVIWVIAERRADGRGISLRIAAPKYVEIHRNSILDPADQLGPKED